MLRIGLLALLSERASHGYELAPLLGELGLRTDTGTLYRMLRSMDHHGEVRSEWNASSRGPARRVYSLTEHGRRRLADALAEQRRTMTQLIGRLNFE